MIKAISDLEKVPTHIKRRIWRELNSKFGSTLFIHRFSTLKDAADYLGYYGQDIGSSLLDKQMERFTPAEREVIYKLVKASPDERKAIRKMVRNQLLKVRNLVLKCLADKQEQKSIWERILK